MSTIDFFQVKQEIVVFLRNSDVMAKALRGVTTVTDTVALSAASQHLIDRSNVRNIRSVAIAGTPDVPLVFGVDYNVDYFYLDGSVRKCRVIFTNPITASVKFEYDYGTDKIYPDSPQETMKIEDFPQIRIDIVGSQSEQAGFGNELRTTFQFEVKVYSQSKTDIQNYTTNARALIIGNAKNFFYVGPYVKPSMTSPILKDDRFSNKIFFQTLEFESRFNLELN